MIPKTRYSKNFTSSLSKIFEDEMCKEIPEAKNCPNNERTSQRPPSFSSKEEEINYLRKQENVFLANNKTKIRKIKHRLLKAGKVKNPISKLI